MLEPIREPPDGVIGFEALGRLEASDYEDVLMPAVRELVVRGDEIRIVLVFEQFEGLSAGAAWHDLTLGGEHLTRWKRIALVTDLDWMITVTSLFGWMPPGAFKRFPVAARNEAIAWRPRPGLDSGGVRSGVPHDGGGHGPGPGCDRRTGSVLTRTFRRGAEVWIMR